MREEIDVLIALDEQADYQATVAAARAALGDDAFNRAWNEGRTMPLEDVVRYARDAQPGA